MADSSLDIVAESKNRMQWWKDAKFGMFIHWGCIRCSAKESG